MKTTSFINCDRKKEKKKEKVKDDIFCQSIALSVCTLSYIHNSQLYMHILIIYIIV